MTRILRKKQRLIFRIGFWTIFCALVADKSAYMAKGLLLNKGTVYQGTNAAYYALIAVIEMWSAAWLLHTFFKVRRDRALARNGRRDHLISELIRSSEVRVGLLLTIGLTRMITHLLPSVYKKDPTVLDKTGQIDNMASLMENLFPDIML